MKKIIIILTCFLLTGCINYTELNELAVVKVLELDYKENKYFLHANIVLDNEDNYEEIDASGTTLEDVFRDAYQTSQKKLYLSHTELLVLTKEVINSKLEEIISYFMENSESRTDFNLALTEVKDIDVKEVNDFMKIVEEETGTTKRITFETFLKDIYSKNLSYLPIIEKKDKVSGIYLIQDYHLTEKLTIDETVIYNLLENNIIKAQIEDISISSNTTIKTEKGNEIVYSVQSTINKDKSKYHAVTKYKMQELIKKLQNKGIDLLNIQGKKVTIRVEGDELNEEIRK